jgi:hypothetical protein
MKSSSKKFIPIKNFIQKKEIQKCVEAGNGTGMGEAKHQHAPT